jgi:hypothetical protein
MLAPVVFAPPRLRKSLDICQWYTIRPPDVLKFEFGVKGDESLVWDAVA